MDNGWGEGGEFRAWGEGNAGEDGGEEVEGMMVRLAWTRSNCSSSISGPCFAM